MCLPFFLSERKHLCENSFKNGSWQVQSEAMLPDCLRFWTWQCQKRGNAARLLQLLNLTTSKTRQCCETSSTFELDNIKNEAMLRDFFNLLHLTASKTRQFATLPQSLNLTTSKMKPFRDASSVFEFGNITNEASLGDFLSFEFDHVEMEASLGDFLSFESWVRGDSLVPMPSAIFPSRPLKYCACQEIAAKSYKVLHPSQNNLSKPKDLMLQNATPLRKSAPWPPNMSDGDVSCTVPATRTASL